MDDLDIFVEVLSIKHISTSFIEKQEASFKSDAKSAAF